MQTFTRREPYQRPGTGQEEAAGCLRTDPPLEEEPLVDQSDEDGQQAEERGRRSHDTDEARAATTARDRSRGGDAAESSGTGPAQGLALMAVDGIAEECLVLKDVVHVPDLSLRVTKVGSSRSPVCQVADRFADCSPSPSTSTCVGTQPILAAMSATPGPLTLSEEDRRVLAPWVADCVERALPSFERVAASDLRPRLAVQGLRAFARHERQVGELRRLALEAHAAARIVTEPAAVAAARAAGQAAGVAHMAGHAFPAAAYAVRTMSVDTTDPEMAAAAEVQWQFRATSVSVRSILRRLPRQQRPAGVAFGATAQLVDLIANDD